MRETLETPPHVPEDLGPKNLGSYDLGFLLSLAAGVVAVTAALAAFLQLAQF